MGVRDALLLNQTGSNFQALQTNDTARLKGDLSLQKDDGTEVLGIDVSTATLNLTGGITGSGNISSSLSSTGSFGQVVATTFHGDGSNLKDTLPRSVGIVTQSAQLAAQISGAFTSGFEMSASISGSATSTGSFGRVEGEFFFGDGSGIKGTLPRTTGILTSSAQIAADISGSFNKGFEYVGIIKGGPVTAGGTWSAGGALASSISYHGAAGDKCGQIVAMGLSGNNSLGSLDATRTFEYNGSSWSEAGDNNTNRARAAGAGTVNSGLFFGGYAPNWYGTSQGATETYNGTSFSEVNDMIMPRRAHMGAGLSSEAALALGGYTDSAPLNPGFSPNMGKFTEVWNGTNWSESGDAPANMKRGGMVGSVNAAVMFGSNTDADLTLHWDGSSWSEGGSGHAPNGIDATHGGTQNDAIRGSTGYVSPNVYTPATQYYNGSTWSEGPNMINAFSHRGMGHNQGNAAGALAAGGEHGVPNFAGQTATEEHTGGNAVISGSFGRLQTTTITGDATGLQSTLPYNGVISGSAQLATSISGSFNKGFEFSGDISGSATSTGSFGRLNFISASGDGAALGGQLYPGVISSSAQLATSISGSFTSGFEFDGQIKVKAGGVFSTGASLGRTVRFLSGLGSVNAAHAIGGNAINTPQAVSEEYDGSSWSEGGELPAANSGGGTSGTVNAGLYFGGAPQGDQTFTYNGTNFSETTDLPGSSAANTVGAGSNQGSALAMIGTSANQLNDAYEWNGSNWSEITAIINNRGRNQGGGESSEAALVVGGDDTPTCIATNRTEIWNGSNWSDVASTSHARRYGSFAGTTNDGIVMGDLNSTGVVEVWDGTTWTETSALISSGGGHGSAASGRVGIGTLAGGAHKFGGGVFSTPASELFSAFENSGSFGRIDATAFHGDATGLQSTLPYPVGMVTGSAQLAANISGSFNKGFGIVGSGEISGSVTSTGSFGRIEADFLHGDGSSIKDSLPRSTGIVSGAAQISSQISGSFNKGFGYEGLISASAGGVASASFHNIEVTSLSGDGSQFSASLQSQLLTGVTQISNSISGSFTSGIDLQGGVSASFGLYGAAWTVKSNMNTGRHALGAVGDSVEALAVGGDAPGGGAPYGTTCTEIWNGQAGVWTEVNDMIEAHNGFSTAGNACAAINHQGYPVGTTKNEFWNGTNWSAAADGGHGAYAQVGDGTANAAIMVGGNNGSGQAQDDTTEWDGTVFYAANNMPTGRSYHGQAGTQNAAYAFAGFAPATSDTTIKYDGTNWSADITFPIEIVGHAGSGTQNATLSSQGCQSPALWPNATKATFEHNGISWAQTADLNTGRKEAGQAGTQGSSLAIGGYLSQAYTEEYSYVASGSFGLVRGTVGGEITTKMFNITSSTFKLPLFSDADLNYHSQEPEESTGSMSGSVDRDAIVNVFNKPGNFFFHSDYNALGFTYVSSSVYSQSLDFATCTYQSASTYTSSQGFITQSHYCYHNVIQYITGSYT